MLNGSFMGDSKVLQKVSETFHWLSKPISKGCRDFSGVFHGASGASASVRGFSRGLISVGSQ